MHENTGSKSSAAGGTFSKASFKNTNSDGVASIEVDVDDPDFWTKVVGDAKEEEDQQLGKRKRAQHSYSEKEYLKRLDAQIKDGILGSDADDNASMSSEWSAEKNGISDDESLHHDNEALKVIVRATKFKKNERYTWGGSGRSEWKQSDAENVLKVLGNFGYGTVSWAKYTTLLSLSKSMKLDEVKRMCWSLSLLCLHEAAEDDALELSRKKKKRIDGDILALSSINEASDHAQSDDNLDEEKDPLEESFKNLLAANASWVEAALADAQAYSNRVASHRDKLYVLSIIDGIRPHNDPKEENPVQFKLASNFAENIWPALRSRGWKEDDTYRNVFMYQGKTFQSIPTVLGAVPMYHPELMNMANSLISSVAASCIQPASAFDPIAKLDLKSVSAESLKSFLIQHAPMQLLGDRKMANRIVLSKRLLNKLVLLHAVHNVRALFVSYTINIFFSMLTILLFNPLALQAVSIVDSVSQPNDPPKARILALSKSININHHRSSLPHSEWTLLHDAILICAVTKHGWIDSHSSWSAIENDRTIRWGSPFEASDDINGDEKKSAELDPTAESKSQAYFDDLHNTASRAITFLSKLSESFSDGLAAPVVFEVSRTFAFFARNKCYKNLTTLPF